MLTALLSLTAGAALGGVLVFVLWMRDRQALVQTVARAEAEREAAVRSDAEQRAHLADSQAQLRDAFSALSRSALKENRDDFLGNAQTVLEPMKEALDKVQRHLNEVDKAREGSFRRSRRSCNLLRDAQEQLRASGRRPVALARLTERPRRLGRDSASAHRRAGRHARAVRFRRESQYRVRNGKPADAGPRRPAAGRRDDRGRREGSHSGLPRGRERERRAATRWKLWTRTPGRSATTSGRSAPRSTGSSFSRRRSSS